MRVAIETDEWYPVYSIQDDTTLEWREDELYDVSQELIDEYWDAMTSFTDIQLKLRMIKGDRNV